MGCNYFDMTDRSDSFETWAGLRGRAGPQGEPGRDGENVALRGPVETTEDLPEMAPASEIWLVGAASPYDGYYFDGARWIQLGPILSGPGVPVGGNAGQYLQKASGTDFDTRWRSPSNADPLMDGTASPGVSSDLARSDHRHPTDTSRAPLTSPELAGTPTAPTPAANNSSTRIATTAYVQGEVADYPRPNLLDNWYFFGGNTNNTYGKFPINQRGLGIYSGSYVYTIDRWYKRGSAALSVTANGLSLGSVEASEANGIIQPIDQGTINLAGKTVTISALITAASFASGSNGHLALVNPSSIGSFSGILGNVDFNSTGVVSKTITVDETLSNPILTVALWHNGSNSSFSVGAVKLEIGDTQTLAHFENAAWVLNDVPDYTEQLARCTDSHADTSDTYSNQEDTPFKTISLTETHPSFHVPNNCRCFGVILDSATSYCGLYAFVSYSGGSASVLKFSSSGPDATGGQNEITFTVDSGKTYTVMLLASSMSILSQIYIN